MPVKTVKIDPQKVSGDLPADTVKRGGGIEQQYEPALEAIKKEKGVWHLLKTFEKRNSAKGRANALAKAHAGYEFAVRTIDATTHNLYARFK
jgi:hypothetical protein